MSMQEEHTMQQRLKQAQKFLGDVVKGGFDFFKAIEVELNKDKSKLKIHQQGKHNQPKKGLTISQQANQPEQSMKISQQAIETSKGLEISQQAVEPTQGLKISQEISQQAQTLMQQGKDNIQEAATQAMGAVNSLAEPTKPKQTVDQAFAEALRTIDADEKEIAPAPEPEKVKDRLLFADGQLQPGITKQDMLAIVELFTAKKGEILQGDAAKGLTVEYDGQLLLKTDKDGRVETNNLQDRDLMANFDFRAKNEIAQFQAQAEQLKPRLLEAIQSEAHELSTLKSQLEERLNESAQKVPTLDPKTPAVQEFNSPTAEQNHQDLGSKRLGTLEPTTVQIQPPAIAIPTAREPLEQTAARNSNETPQVNQPLPTPVQAAELDKSTVPAQAPQQNAQTLNRLAKTLAVAFNANHKGEYPLQGRIQAPTGAVIEKTITDEKNKFFDLAIEKDGQKYQIASYKGGQITVKEGMTAALPEIQKIAQSMSPDGKFETPAIIPKMEPKEQQIQQEMEPSGR